MFFVKTSLKKKVKVPQHNSKKFHLKIFNYYNKIQTPVRINVSMVFSFLLFFLQKYNLFQDFFKYITIK